jgi:hypothetical protein
MLSVRAKNDAVVSTSIYQLEAQGSHTLLTYTIKTTHRGVARLWVAFQKDATQARIAHEVRTLKMVIEQPHSGSGGAQASDNSHATAGAGD